MIDSQLRLIWLRILACVAAVVLACGVRNYLTAIVSGTALCPYLCPSLFDVELFFSYPFLEQLLETRSWAQEKSQDFVELFLTDKWKLGTALVFAPVVEELIYRGPLYLAREFSNHFLWWLLGTGLTIVFASSHGRNGLALLPLIVLGISSLWLISTTGRFWPSIVLHFLHNFFFSSVLVYQSLWISD